MRRIAGRLLRTGADFRATTGSAIVGRESRHTEVDQVRGAAAVQQNICRFDIPVHDALGVHVAQRISDQAERRQCIFRRLAAQHAEIDIAYELQAVIRPVRIVVEFENAHDMRMHEVAADAPFLAQQIPVGLVFREPGGEELERYLRIGLAVAGQPDFRHAARAEPAHERVSLRQPRTFFQHPHRLRSDYYPVGWVDLAGFPTSMDSV